MNKAKAWSEIQIDNDYVECPLKIQFYDFIIILLFKIKEILFFNNSSNFKDPFIWTIKL